MDNVIVACTNCGTKNKIPAAKQHLGPRCGRCKTPVDLAGTAIPVDLDDSSFDTFIRTAGLPVMVDFFSPSCGPCRSLAPVIQRLAGRYIGRAIIAKLDTSRQQAVAGRYRIRGVPTLLFFKNGQLLDQLTGAAPEHILVKKLDAIL